MSYEFSFNKQTGSIMLGCIFVAGALLLFAGFLVGRESQNGARNQAIPAVNAPVMARNAGAKRNTEITRNTSSESSVPQSESDRMQTTPDVSGQHSYCLQYGSFQKKKNAENTIKGLKKNGIVAKIFVFVDSNSATWYAVRSGSYPSIDQAAESASKIAKETNMSVLVRRSDAI